MNKIFSLIKRIFDYGVNYYDLEYNPVIKIGKVLKRKKKDS